MDSITARSFASTQASLRNNTQWLSHTLTPYRYPLEEGTFLQEDEDHENMIAKINQDFTRDFAGNLNSLLTFVQNTIDPEEPKPDKNIISAFVDGLQSLLALSDLVISAETRIRSRSTKHNNDLWRFASDKCQRSLEFIDKRTKPVLKELLQTWDRLTDQSKTQLAFVVEELKAFGKTFDNKYLPEISNYVQSVEFTGSK